MDSPVAGTSRQSLPVISFAEPDEAVLGRQLDKRNFRAKLVSQNLVEPVASAHRTGRHRPAQLYRWTSSAENVARTPEPPAPTRARKRARK